MSGPKTSFPSNPSDTFTRTCYFVCFFFSPLSLKMGPMSTKSWCPLCPPPLVHFCFLSVSLAQHQHQNPDQNPTTHRYTELNMPTCSSGRPPPPPASLIRHPLLQAPHRHAHLPHGQLARAGCRAPAAAGAPGLLLPGRCVG